MWEIIWYDVIYQINLKLNLMTINHLQIFNSIAEVASGIFSGGKEKGEPVRINDLPAEVAVAKMNEVFQMAGAG